MSGIASDRNRKRVDANRKLNLSLTKFSSARQFINHIRYFERFKMKVVKANVNLKKKTVKTPLNTISFFLVFGMPAC